MDLEFGRSYYNSSNRSFRPHLGLKGAWINLIQNTTYSGQQLDNENVKTNLSSRFGGIGPRIGVNSLWYLTNGFSLLGNIGGSFLWGKNHVMHKETYSRNPVRDRVKVGADSNQFVPNADMKLGLVFARYLNDNKQHLMFSAGYELQYYFRVNQSLIPDRVPTDEDDPYFIYKRPGNDASLHGLTLHAKLDF